MGPVLGFATILIIGIASSVFTAVLVARVLIEGWMGKDRSISFSTPLSAGRFKNIKTDFLSLRRISYVFSGVLILIGIAAFLTKGFDLGVDFKGGRDYQVRFEQAVNNADIKSSLDEVFWKWNHCKNFWE